MSVSKMKITATTTAKIPEDQLHSSYYASRRHYTCLERLLGFENPEKSFSVQPRDFADVFSQMLKMS